MQPSEVSAQVARQEHGEPEQQDEGQATSVPRGPQRVQGRQGGLQEQQVKEGQGVSPPPPPNFFLRN